MTSPTDGKGRTPRPSRGWTIAWTLAVTQTVGYGILFYAYGVLTVPMEEALGWTRTQTSGAFSVALLTSGMAALGAGRIVDRYGGRALMTLGSIAAGALVLAWSYVTTLPGLYLVQAGIGLAMAAVTYEVAFAVVARWFVRERIRALLVVTMVAGLASTIFVPLATALVEGLGWRAALRVLALMLWAITVPLHGLVLKRAPDRPCGGAGGDATEAPEPVVTAREAWREPTFWWLTAGFALDRMAIVAVGAHAVPLLLERGHPPGVVAAAAGSIGLLQVAGRLLFAPATARASLASLAVATYLVRAVAVGALLLVPGLAGVWVFAGLFGVANGASTLARAGLVAETFGGAHFGTISGSMTTLIAVAQTVAPLAVGALRVATGGYATSLLLIGTFAVLAAGAVERSRRLPPPRAGDGR